MDSPKFEPPLAPDRWVDEHGDVLFRFAKARVGRTDVAEEMTRLDSHLKQFHELLASKEPSGRKMDFLVQEMHREANTVGSKSQSAEAAASVVSLKAEIERIRARIFARHSAERATRICDHQKNLIVFPNLVINDHVSITIRLFQPESVGGYPHPHVFA